MATVLTERTHKNTPFVKQKHSSSNQNHNYQNKKTQNTTLLDIQNKKSQKTKNVLPILQQLKIDQLKENSPKQSQSKTKGSSILVQSSKDSSNPSPFNNLSNFRPLHLDPIDSNTAKAPISQQNLHQKQSPRNSPKMTQKQRQICQKINQQKVSNFSQNKKKSISHRIHITSSKEKQNNFKKINQDKESGHNGTKTNVKPNIQLKLTQNIEHSEIQNQKLQSLVSSRQRTSHSFMIRKKIPPSSLQNQKLEQKFSNLPNYRKDRFIREEKVDLVQQSMKPEKQSVMFQKYQSQKIGANYESKKLQQKVENQENELPSKAMSKTKSLKVRKTRYSRVDELANNQQIIFQKIVKSPPCKKSKFINTIQDNLDAKKVHTIDSKPSQLGGNLLKEECSFVDQCKQYEGSSDQKNYEQMQQGLLNSAKRPQTLSKQSQNYNYFKPSEDRHLASSQLKTSRKRVSSIRALKNCYKNFQTEEQSQFLTDSKMAESTKRKQRQLACLTHKIKWGGHQKKKSISQKGIEFANNFQQNNQLKSKKKLRFSKDLEEIDVDGPFKNGILRVVSKKDCSLIIEKNENTDQVVSTGSRSLIAFDDPGISIIVRKDSSAQSSQLQPGFNTTETNLQQMNNYELKSHRNERYNRNSIKLQSLRELFIELKSHKSIYVTEDKQDSQQNKISIIEDDQKL